MATAASSNVIAVSSTATGAVLVPPPVSVTPKMNSSPKMMNFCPILPSISRT